MSFTLDLIGSIKTQVKIITNGLEYTIAQENPTEKGDYHVE